MDNNQEELYGLCFHCKQPKSHYDWCPRCDCQKLIDEFSNWTSVNKDIDEFIQATQRNATSYASYLEWIPYSRLEIEFDENWWLGKSYTAKWKDGERLDDFWYTINTQRQRFPIQVTIKSFDKNYFKHITNFEYFMNELKFQHQFMTCGRRQNPPHYILEQFENLEHQIESINVEDTFSEKLSMNYDSELLDLKIPSELLISGK
ncbi:15298_t:CDS:2 [Funneliformis mosseae]|uniref:15298_t:CDS:1 n=1 Tax=Funneliformis mosseae TaxID=27381 RepID=A0A9N9D4P1_FUNMO|nr:15298_t:CDS:2 [Funneliformis mosseae]